MEERDALGRISQIELRDLFAAAALAGMSNADYWVQGTEGGEPAIYAEATGQEIGSLCYEMADSLMKNRHKEPFAQRRPFA